jgi:hypothetical protein
VTDRANVDVWLCSLKLFLRHCLVCSSSKFFTKNFTETVKLSSSVTFRRGAS